MPAPKSSSSSSSRSKRTTRSASSASKATRASAARSGAKATGTSAGKAASRTTTQAKSGPSKTRKTAKAGASKTARAAGSGGTRATGRAAGKVAASTAKSARSGAKGTATAARSGAKRTATTAKAGATRTRRAGGGDGISGLAEELLGRVSKSQDHLVMLTRDRIQETLDEAASRGRVTRKDANDLVAKLVQRGRSQADELRAEIEQLLGRGVGQLEAAGKRARRAEPVDRIVRGADRARRAAGVGPSFPILGYDDLNVRQVVDRLRELRKPDVRKVRTYEQKNANRKSVMAAIDKALS